MLTIENLSVAYGSAEVLRNVHMQVHEGQIVSLLGANGASKSTLLRTISGLIRPSSGAIVYNQRSLVGLSADEIVSDGIVQVPEGRRIFSQFSVEENLRVGAFLRTDRAMIQSDLALCYKIFPVLHNRRRQVAGTMSGGEQQMLAIARGLMAKPTILLLDEPSLGVAPIIVRRIFDSIKEIRDRSGLSIVVVEQNANIALRYSEYAYVIDHGTIVAADTSSKLMRDNRIKEAYLGG